MRRIATIIALATLIVLAVFVASLMCDAQKIDRQAEQN